VKSLKAEDLKLELIAVQTDATLAPQKLLRKCQDYMTQKQTFHYTRRITPKRVTSLLCPSLPLT